MLHLCEFQWMFLYRANDTQLNNEIALLESEVNELKNLVSFAVYIVLLEQITAKNEK